MSPTPYSQSNADFSNKAHATARSSLYPQIFELPFENLEFEDTLVRNGSRGEVLDGEMAIDRIVRVKPLVNDFKSSIVFTVQERFRRKRFAQFEDLTITEWNPRTNLPSELYKLEANMFLYGYFDPPAGNFVDAIAVNLLTLLMKLCNGKIRYTRNVNPRSGQPFLCFKFSDLEEAGCVIFRLKRS